MQAMLGDIGAWVNARRDYHTGRIVPVTGAHKTIPVTSSD